MVPPPWADPRAIHTPVPRGPGATRLGASAAAGRWYPLPVHLQALRPTASRYGRWGRTKDRPVGRRRGASPSVGPGGNARTSRAWKGARSMTHPDPRGPGRRSRAVVVRHRRLPHHPTTLAPVAPRRRERAAPRGPPVPRGPSSRSPRSSPAFGRLRCACEATSASGGGESRELERLPRRVPDRRLHRARRPDSPPRTPALTVTFTSPAATTS